MKHLSPVAGRFSRSHAGYNHPARLDVREQAALTSVPSPCARSGPADRSPAATTAGTTATSDAPTAPACRRRPGFLALCS